MRARRFAIASALLRPYDHDVRFIDTGNINGADTEGRPRPGKRRDLQSLPSRGRSRRQKVGRDGSDPTFFGGYIEGGYFFTDEIARLQRRPSSIRAKVRKQRGRWGSLGLNLQWDHLDLTDKGLIGGARTRSGLRSTGSRWTI